MKWLKRIWFFILKLTGVSMISVHEKCISTLEDRLFGLSDDEAELVESMLDGGCDCESVFVTLQTARRKQAFKRKLTQLGIKSANLEHLIEQYINDLRGSTKVDDLVKKAHQEYLDAIEKKNAVKTNSI